MDTLRRMPLSIQANEIGRIERQNGTIILCRVLKLVLVRDGAIAGANFMVTDDVVP
jgi:hypothetical protein